MNEANKNFHTLRGYALRDQSGNGLTPGMEDYLEMIFRLSQKKAYTRINDLAGALNVQPPSATKMVQKLAEASYLNYERYGVIELTARGYELGMRLLHRHQTLEKFLRLLGVKQNILKDTEKIEHNVSQETLSCIFDFVEFTSKNPEYIYRFRQYQERIRKP